MVLQIHPRPRHISRPTWIVTLLSLACLFLVFSNIQKYNSGCNVFNTSSGCRSAFSEPAASEILREYEEIASRVVMKEILDPVRSKNPKVAFMFMTRGFAGNGRYSTGMLPEIEKKNFRKGSQWFAMKRQHAVITLADNLYYPKFRDVCLIIDPGGISNWSLTHVDWSEKKFHPKMYKASDVTSELIKNITSVDISEHVTSDNQKKRLIQPCLRNGIRRPCYLFARKFHPDTLENLLNIFSNFSTI
ncbi:Core-2/I-branching beta-1,6-N-acetylglucosaminyltransferase family protein [Citrus sinensis]|nr:Core-2/I-branching beta-1,6-N-acetylglucosaminyltransferase family protein [Citrus sinensis]